MKWNGVELIDGEFYFVELKRWSDCLPNEWVFVYKENVDDLTKHYCAVKVSQENCLHPVFGHGRLCEDFLILDLRIANQDDMSRFWERLDKFGFYYNSNTKYLFQLREGSIYLVKTSSNNTWLFKKLSHGRDNGNKTGCSCALCLTDMYKSEEPSYVCHNNEIKYLKEANANHIAIWNREFDDNVELR